MSLLAHLLILTLSLAAAAAAFATVPDTWPDLWPGADLGSRVGAAAVAFLFVALIHEVLARRAERLDLFDELYDLRQAHADTLTELGALTSRVAQAELQGAGQDDKLLAEMRLVRSLLGRLTERRTGPEPAPNRPPPPPLARPHPDANTLSRDQVFDIVRDALADNRIDLYLQPVVSLPQRKVRYYECLSRIRDTEGHVIAPDLYLDVAEEKGLVSTIDNLLLFRCIQLVRRMREPEREVGFFCNLSPHSLGDEAFFDQFIDFLDHNPELTENLIFEFEADQMLVAGPETLARLKTLSALGYRFSADGVHDLDLDVIGLARRKVEFIKVDVAALVPNLAQPPGAALRELHLTAAENGVRVIASKVEAEDTVPRLLDQDVDLAQGFLFGEPRPMKLAS